MATVEDGPPVRFGWSFSSGSVACVLQAYSAVLFRPGPSLSSRPLAHRRGRREAEGVFAPAWRRLASGEQAHATGQFEQALESYEAAFAEALEILFTGLHTQPKLQRTVLSIIAHAEPGFAAELRKGLLERISPELKDLLAAVHGRTGLTLMLRADELRRTAEEQRDPSQDPLDLNAAPARAAALYRSALVEFELAMSLLPDDASAREGAARVRLVLGEDGAVRR